VASNASTPAEGATKKASQTEVLATTVATIVERQLTQFAAVINQRFEALTTEVHQLVSLTGHQQNQINELEQRLAAIPQKLQTELPQHLRAATEQMQVDIEQRHVALATLVDDLEVRARRNDDQAAAIVQHLNDTTAALAQRMDDGDANLARAVEERLAVVRNSLENIGPEVERQVSESMATVQSKLEYVESATVDKVMAAENRINEQQGNRIAQVEATIGRIGSGFDDSMIAFNQRLLELDNSTAVLGERFATLEDKVGKIDESAFDDMKSQMSNAIGEAMLVRIEMDRLAKETNESMDKTALRLADVESKLDDEMDVSAAVQLERLDELERAIAVLDPAQFVRKSELNGAAPAPTPAPAMAPPMPTGEVARQMPSSELPMMASPETPRPADIPSLTL
jgi:hypothetical protein